MKWLVLAAVAYTAGIVAIGRVCRLTAPPPEPDPTTCTLPAHWVPDHPAVQGLQRAVDNAPWN